MNEQDAAVAIREADEMLALLSQSGEKSAVLLHGCENNTWPCLKHAAKLGLDSRIGHEDTLILPDGKPATNAELVAEAVKLYRQAGQ